MLVNPDSQTTDIETITHSVTLVPRLEYSINLLDDIIYILFEKQAKLRDTNRDLAADFDEYDPGHADSLKLEHQLAFSLEILVHVKKRMGQISHVGSIPKILPCSIPMIRTVSAQLFDILPSCSQKLSETSVHLGSIVIDSATLTTARFDFSQSNAQSATLLNKVKLMVDSKLSKQYPNVDFFRLCNT